MAVRFYSTAISSSISALPTRVAVDLGRVDERSSDDAVVLPFGNDDQMVGHTVAFVHAGTSTFSGSTRPSSGIAAAAPKPDAPRAA